MPAPGLLAKSLSMSSYSFIIYLMTRSNESVRNHSADIISPPPYPTTVNPSPQSYNIYGIFKLIAVALWNRELAEGGNFTSFLAINSFFFSLCSCHTSTSHFFLSVSFFAHLPISYSGMVGNPERVCFKATI